MDEGGVAVYHGDVVVDILLGGGVAPEVDCSGRRHAHQVRAQASVQAFGAFIGPDMPKYYCKIITCKNLLY